MIKIKLLILVVIFSLILSENTYSHVVLDYPIGGETFQVGEVVTIRWQVAINHGPANWDLFFSEDGGSSWESIALNLPETQLTYNWTVPNITTDSGQVKVVQDNVTGQDYSDASGNFTINTATGINEYINHVDNFILFSAYPNPFNPATTIEFSLPRTSEVTLKVFNLLGEEVATLLSASLLSGSHSIKWNASNLASGVYLYRLQAGNFVEIRKMILMR